jgi:peptidylprolyl isomerase
VGTEKRERQRAARLEKISTQATAAKRDRARGTALRIGAAAVVVLAVLFGVSLLVGDDSDGDAETPGAAADCRVEAPAASTDTIDTAGYSQPDLAAEVLRRDPPAPEPPPADTAADALETTTLIEGEGEGARVGQTVVVQYAGVLDDCTMFDESWSRGEPFSVTLGEGQVIAGWDQGLVGAKLGERRHLLIGSQNAYGDRAQGPIPSDSPLAFDVDVVDIRTAPPAPAKTAPPG